MMNLVFATQLTFRRVPAEGGGPHRRDVTVLWRRCRVDVCQAALAPVRQRGRGGGTDGRTAHSHPIRTCMET